MLASWQSSQQQNIVKNNVDSSINNSVANLSSNTIDFNIYNSAGSMITGGRDVTMKNCDATLRADINTIFTADIRSISKTDTQFDNTIGVNISNDLKNETKQETPGIGGGFLSAQINNQLNEVSNDVSNQISNNVYIDRSNRINTVSENLSKSGVEAGRDFLCENSSLDFSSNVGESTAMDIFTDTKDDLRVTNDIHVALTNKLSNKVEQGGSIGMAIIMCIFLFILFVKAAHSIWGGGNNSTTAILFIAGFIWITYVGILANTELILTDDEKYEFRKKTVLNLGYGGSVCGDSELALDENSKLSEDDCIKFYKDIHFWDKTWSDKTIRNKIKIEDGYGETIDYRNLKRDIYSPTPCPPDFSGSSDKCRTKTEDFKYELLLKRAFSCVDDNEDHITQDMLSYHHELYSSGGPLQGEIKIRNLSGSSQPLDMSVDIIQPGTGYLTGGPYKTSCKRVINGETKTCCKEDKPDCIDLKVNVKSVDSCSSSETAIKNDDMTDGGDLNKGYGCYRKSDGTSTLSESTSLSEYLFGDILWDNVTGATPCNYTGVVSGLKGFIEGGLGVCADTTDTEGNDVSCVKGDKCFINYKTQQQEADRGAGEEDVNLDSSFVDQYCPKEVLPSGGPGGGPNIGCIFEVGGVEQIKIKNASEAEDSGHVIHPDNIYTIDSGKDNSDSSKKALWADEQTGFDVRYLKNKLVNPPPTAPGSAPLPPEDGIWATSELLITTNSNNFPTKYASNKIEGDEICKNETSDILSNRAWPGMENICEPKFKLMPLLSRTSASPGNAITDSASGERTLGCKNSMDLSGNDDMDKLKQCKCADGSEMDLEYSYTSTYLGYIIVPLIIILLIVAVLSFGVGRFNKVAKDLTGKEPDLSHLTPGDRFGGNVRGPAPESHRPRALGFVSSD